MSWCGAYTIGIFSVFDTPLSELHSFLPRNCVNVRKSEKLPISPEKRKKCLQTASLHDIIIKRDCTRYAMKREVAVETTGNFRRVCPI